MSGEALLELVGHLMVQSLLSIGGVSVILAELHRVVVLANGWMTDTEFASMFALAQASPGPNMLFVTVIGWSVAGVGGALVATAAFLLPSSLLAALVARGWQAWDRRPWFIILRRGLVPLTVGLVIASGVLVAEAAAESWTGYAVTAAAAGAALAFRLHPVVILAVAAALGAAGLV